MIQLGRDALDARSALFFIQKQAGESMSASHNGMLRVGPTRNNLTALRTPSEMTWGFQRVSAPDAGRTENARMHVNQVATKIKLNLSWTGLSPSEAHTIATAFKPEYFFVEYWDILENDLVVKKFYTGDWSAPFKVWTANDKRFASLSFNIIEV